MKVVLFCGGLGTRLREHSDTIPKPLVTIGNRPLLWHLMRYYAHFGHKDFILCLGYRGEMVREYFLKYQETMSNDFTWQKAVAASNCTVRTRRTGMSRSSTPACTATSASAWCACVRTCRGRRSSSPTMRTGCPICRCRACSRTFGSQACHR